MPQPPGENSLEGKGGRGEDRASEKLRTAMAGLEVRRDDMYMEVEAEVEQDVAEAE